MYIEKSLEGVA